MREHATVRTSTEETPMAPRLAPTTADERDDETNALVEAVGGLNIFTTLARHPKALKRWLVFGGHVLSKNSLGDRDRELLILRAGWRCDSEYEFGQHTIIGERVGLTPTEVARLTEADLDGWSADDALLLGPSTNWWPTTASATGPGRAWRPASTTSS